MCLFCVCTSVCMTKIDAEEFGTYLYPNATHMSSECFKRKQQEVEQRGSLKNRHELFTPSDKSTKREWKRDCRRNWDGSWWRKRQTDRLTRTIGAHVILTVTTAAMTWKKALKRFSIEKSILHHKLECIYTCEIFKGWKWLDLNKNSFSSKFFVLIINIKPDTLTSVCFWLMCFHYLSK